MTKHWDYAQCAAHVFKMAEKCNETVFEILTISGIGDYPFAEMQLIAERLSEAEQAHLVQRLMKSAMRYKAQSEDAIKNPMDHCFTSADLELSAREMARRAGLWAVA